LVDTGNGIVEHGTVAPIAVDHAHLPDLFNAVDIAADEKGFEVFFNGGVHRFKSLGERRTAQAVEAVI
jgi:hypothetical protein